jgi:hypothetical protein
VHRPVLRYHIGEALGGHTCGEAPMKIERDFQVEKETKNTVRYAEVAEGQPPVIGTLYLQKWALKGTPTKLKVTIEVPEE